MSDPRSHDCEALLASADWVRALARQLVADAHAADDLAQDALAAALVRPPPTDRPLRGWLAGVLRNLVRQERREAGNRGARERASARAEAEGSSAEMLERLDSHRAVVEAVARLDEPYRAAILMRYFEGLTPAAIARRTGTPRRTVHTRLQRALARLRVELDRAHGGERRTWFLALLPYARGSGGWNAVATGALVMETKLKLAVAVLAAVGVCSTLVLLRGGEEPSVPARAAEPAALAREESPEAERERADAPAVVARREPGSAPAAPVTEPVPPAAPRLLGRVLDVERAPVAGIRVRYSPRGPDARDGLEALTDASGAFALARPAHGGTLDVASPGWTSLFRPSFDQAPGERELVLIVARSVTLGGRVVDERGNEIESAVVAVPLPYHFRSRFDAILDGASSIERSTTTGPGGRFELPDVPVVPGVELVTTRAGYVEDHRALPAYDELELELVLARASQAPGQLLGTVVDPAGTPVEGAWVGLGEQTTKSERGGTFALGLEPEERWPAERVLRAVKQGFLPAELRLARGEDWPTPLVLELGPPPLTLSGRVVDSRGDPAPGVEVWTEDEESFGYIALGDGETSVRVGASIEGILRDDPWTFRARADESGRFTLSGLLPRDYRLRAFDRARLALAAETVSVGARDVVLRMPEEELHALVAGRVTDLSGEPLAGLEVVLERSPLAGGPANLLESAAVSTDSDGRFSFENVSRAVNAIQVRGLELGVSGFRRLLAANDDLAVLHLEVPLRVHAQVDAGEAEGIERAALLDAHGAKLPLSVDHGEHAYVMDDIALEQGRSEAFSVSELATTLVLYAKGVELARVPVSLVRGGLNTLRP